MSALHIFDMDGTLLCDSTASLEISRRLGGQPVLERLEDSFAAGEIGAAEFSVATRELWHELTDDIVADVVTEAPWIDGIDDVCADIAARGETSMLITMSPDFFARHLHVRGIDVVCASTWPPLPFTAPVDPSKILAPTDKVRLVERERAWRRLPARACVAYGDSLSDQPLFATLTNTVAINADAALEAAARVIYRGQDLREAYTEGRQVLNTDMTAATGENKPAKDFG